ncbi:MAG TPA: universal stress protein [Flavobacterium sp.]|uniref:universal stress protein n=1 Tax=Flavobacterium sp. TaxID=239 RepID=UPI002C7941A6|nr:universal stress protein [Flavobacterium sp.]HNP32338.1 universal stress protein [Flavobacterium sp.]
MKKILVPLDFTETSENAFVYAVEMAKLFKAELVLLHTFELPIIDSQMAVPLNYAEIYDTLQLTNSNHFKDEISKLRIIAKEHKAEDIVMNHIMMDGDLIFAIKEVVQDEDIDFVVMGTNGASGWFDSFIGTNTASVIADLSIPVLSVAHDSKFEKIETIGFTTCYTEKDIQALIEVLIIAKRMKAKVKCLYVKTSHSDVKGEIIHKWESHFENENNLEFLIIPSEDIEGTIEEFIVNQNIDLLAMGTHKRNIFTQFFTTSKTQKMSQHLKTPVLAIHE